MKIFHRISRLPEFDRDMKRLLKKYGTLEGDLETCVAKQLNLYHKLRLDNRGVVPISDLPISNPPIYKVLKFACRSLKGKGAQSGIRVIYAYFEEEDKIELIEIYYKGDKENEDRDRILRHYKT